LQCYYGIILLASSAFAQAPIFEDRFDATTRGPLVENLVHHPPPKGLGYTWKVLKQGYVPTQWTLSDSRTSEDPKRGFWVIPEAEEVLDQAGRSADSGLFAKTPVPANVTSYDLTFRMNRSDNDYIACIINAPEPEIGQGFEFGWQAQLPGTDESTEDLYLDTGFEKKIIPGMSKRHEWVTHRVEVRGTLVRWLVDDKLMAEREVADLQAGGYFGFRQKYERNTRYDDVVVKAVR
jgi:hypothetical protein